MSQSSCRSVLFLVKRMQRFSQVTILVVPAHHGLSSPVKDSWESTRGLGELVQRTQTNTSGTQNVISAG